MYWRGKKMIHKQSCKTYVGAFKRGEDSYDPRDLTSTWSVYDGQNFLENKWIF